MKILITGSNGMLGQKIVYGLLGDPPRSVRTKLRTPSFCGARAVSQGGPLCRIPDELRKKVKDEVEIIAASRGENRLKNKNGYLYEELDITDKFSVEKVFSKHKPDVVINTAAMTNVDACETNREECWKANVDAVKYMVDVLEHQTSNIKHQTHLIHLSTDFVFDGMKGGEYSEEDKPNPLSYYALSKYEGEKIVMTSNLKWAIIRTIIIYGVVDDRNRGNLVLWVKNNLEKRQKINVITDQFRAPTLSEDLAQGCILAAMKGAEGIFHISGKETHSILELAYRIADFWNLDKSYINPVTSEELNQPAKRPPRTGFILDKARKVLGYNPHSFEEGLEIINLQLKP